MGNWHRPYQTAIIIKKIKHDVNPLELYEQELSLGWTESSTFRFYWANLRNRVKKLTGLSVYSYIKLDTINYRNFIKNKEYKINAMARKKIEQTKKFDYKKAFKKLDRDELIIIIESLKERIDQLEQEKEEQQKIKSKCLTAITIKENFKKSKKRFNKSLICYFLDLSRRTLNDKILKNNIFESRKIRKDSISTTSLLCSLVWDSFSNSNGIYGQRRVHKDIINKGFNYTLSVVSSAIRRCKLYANELKVQKKKYELKNISFPSCYLVSKNNLINYKPGEIFSIDFFQIETIEGKMWLHGARDIISGKIEFLELCDDQTIKTVLKHYRKLPMTTKIINTDHGLCYLSYEVQDYLKSKNILQSVGIVGCLYHNRWIEDFWKRIKYEWFTIYPMNKVTLLELHLKIKKYIDFFNNSRLSKFSGSWNIQLKIDNEYKINSGQFI